MKELFTGILNISISAGILIVVCVLVRLIFRKMPKFVRCLMWLLVAVRLAIPFNIESPFSLLPAREYVTISSGEESSVAVNEYEKANGAADKADGKAIVIIKGEIENDVSKFDYMNVLSIVWIIGVAAVLIYAVIAYIRLKRTVADAVLLRKNIYQSERVGTAFILGITSPKIYIPYGLSVVELYMTLNHERAHLARRDHLVKPLGFIITAVYWFNPLVWLAYILLCKDIELACDEKVIKKIGYDKKKDYSQTLLNLSIPRKYISACPVAFGEGGTSERIKNVLKMKKSKKIVVAAAVALCAILAVCFLTYPKDTKAAAPEQTEAQVIESTEAQAAESTEVQAVESTEVQAVESTEVQAAESTEVQVEESTESAEVQAAESTEVQVEESTESTESTEAQVAESTEEADSDVEMCFPVIGSGFVAREFSESHLGIDICAVEGTDVVSLYSGTVEDAGFDDQKGNYIVIKNSAGWTVKYLHLKDTPIVSKGDSVESGTKVGEVGSTGYSTGPHLHLEVIDDNGLHVDPLTVLK